MSEFCAFIENMKTIPFLGQPIKRITIDLTLLTVSNNMLRLY